MVLPDVIQPGLFVVFCGTAAGEKSAARTAYFADGRNRFWGVLGATGLTPVIFKPEKYADVLQCKIGLTDLAKYAHGSDANLKPGDYDVPGFMKKIERCNPSFVAFNGKTAAEQVLKRRVGYGLQPDRISRSRVWVLPSTVAWPQNWDQRHWQALADAVLELRQQEE